MRFASVGGLLCALVLLAISASSAALVCWMLALKFCFADNIFTLDVMEEPVIATDGFTYEQRRVPPPAPSLRCFAKLVCSCILEWFRTKRTSPTTGDVLTRYDALSPSRVCEPPVLSAQLTHCAAQI